MNSNLVVEQLFSEQEQLILLQAVMQLKDHSTKTIEFDSGQYIYKPGKSAISICADVTKKDDFNIEDVSNLVCITYMEPDTLECYDQYKVVSFSLEEENKKWELSEEAKDIYNSIVVTEPFYIVRNGRRIYLTDGELQKFRNHEILQQARNVIALYTDDVSTYNRYVMDQEKLQSFADCLEEKFHENLGSTEETLYRKFYL